MSKKIIAASQANKARKKRRTKPDAAEKPRAEGNPHSADFVNLVATSLPMPDKYGVVKGEVTWQLPDFDTRFDMCVMDGRIMESESVPVAAPGDGGSVVAYLDFSGAISSENASLNTEYKFIVRAKAGEAADKVAVKISQMMVTDASGKVLNPGQFAEMVGWRHFPSKLEHGGEWTLVQEASLGSHDSYEKYIKDVRNLVSEFDVYFIGGGRSDRRADGKTTSWLKRFSQSMKSGAGRSLRGAKKST